MWPVPLVRHVGAYWEPEHWSESLPAILIELRMGTGGFRARALGGDMQPVSLGPVVGLITAISD